MYLHGRATFAYQTFPLLTFPRNTFPLFEAPDLEAPDPYPISQLRMVSKPQPSGCLLRLKSLHGSCRYICMYLKLFIFSPSNLSFILEVVGGYGLCMWGEGSQQSTQKYKGKMTVPPLQWREISLDGTDIYYGIISPLYFTSSNLIE